MVLDISTPDFPGIQPIDNGWVGPRPTPDLHPHLKLNETMTSVPKVKPGDMVFWHCVRHVPLLFPFRVNSLHRMSSTLSSQNTPVTATLLVSPMYQTL
jgi:hypothetical protein